jgi:hypothetical protein
MMTTFSDALCKLIKHSEFPTGSIIDTVTLVGDHPPRDHVTGEILDVTAVGVVAFAMVRDVTDHELVDMIVERKYKLDCSLFAQIALFLLDYDPSTGPSTLMLVVGPTST